MGKVSQLIVETFEKEQPAFTGAIKMLVRKGESRNRFINFVKKTFKEDYETSATAQLAITCFDYYTKAKKSITL